MKHRLVFASLRLLTYFYPSLRPPLPIRGLLMGKRQEQQLPGRENGPLRRRYELTRKIAIATIENAP